MARKSVFDYKVKRGAAGTWVVIVNDNSPTRKVYRILRGETTGTWYVTITGMTHLFNAGTLRDCILWICTREKVV